ncbi:MAG: hypothetical protein ACT4NY_23850 [Pseudonocardiales bacterium]
MIKSGSVGAGIGRTKIFKKILITALFGAPAYFITDQLDQGAGPFWALTVSVFISGVALVVQFLVESDHRLESLERKHENHSEEMRSLMKEGFARTSEAAELFQAVESSALETQTVTQLVRHAAQISRASPPLVHKLAQLQIIRISDFLKELSEGGVVEYEGEDRDWMLGFTIYSKHTIDATSLSTVDAGTKSFDGGLWTSDLGRRYLTLQKQAMNRGVVIRRVFIIDRPGQIGDADFLNIYRQHKNLGIRVKVLDRSTITDASILEGSLIDFVVFDSTLSYETTPASMLGGGVKPTIVKTHLKLQLEAVKERIQRFEDLWISAQELE